MPFLFPIVDVFIFFFVDFVPFLFFLCSVVVEFLRKRKMDECESKIHLGKKGVRRLYSNTKCLVSLLFVISFIWPCLRF